jgi:hypothetical protein
LSLDVVYQLSYFYVMCYEYVDNNSCRHLGAHDNGEALGDKLYDNKGLLKWS